MTTNPPKWQASKPEESVIQWLLDSDPSIRWQVLRDLLGAPAEEVAVERARVTSEGWGARLLALRRDRGTQMTRLDGVAIREHCRALEHQAQLAHIARPRILFELLQRRR